MTCPRCNNVWDVSKSPCGRCGLLVRLPGNMGAARAATQAQKDSSISGGMPPVKQQPKNVPPPASGSGSFPTFPPTVPKPSAQEPLNGRHRSQPTFPPISGTSSDAHRMMRTSGPFPQQRNSGVSNPSLPPLEPTSRPLRPANPMPPAQSFDMRTSGNAFPAQVGDQNQSQPPSQYQATKDATVSTNGFSLRNMPPTPRSTDQLGDHGQVVQSPLRSRRLVPETPFYEGQRKPVERPHQGVPTSATTPSFSRTEQDMSSMQEKGVRTLLPGAVLRGGRYRLQELQRLQEWQSDIYEAMWVAQDAQRSGAQVLVCEVVVPESASMRTQSMLRTATIALTSAGRLAQIPTLWDVFSDQGRHFFVFERLEGESLLTRMRRTGRAIPEQEIIECCLQMLEVLEQFSQQSPPLVHGLIRPEHIWESRQSGHFLLTNFSVILAGDAQQLLAGIEPQRLSAYVAPELGRELIDGRSDLYSLLATAYHAVTGSVPAMTGGVIPQAQRLNPNVSRQFDAILNKGLRPHMQQRYQRPAELRQDILLMRSVSGSIAASNSASASLAGSAQRFEAVPPVKNVSTPKTTSDDVSQLLPNMMASAFIDDLGDPDAKALLPVPEALPPMTESNDMLSAGIWIAAILLCLIVLVALSRGFV